MTSRVHAFEEILRAHDPLATESFHLLLEETAKETDPRLLREFFVYVNDELYQALWHDTDGKKVWIQEMLHTLLATHQELTITTLKSLMERMELNYDDPLVQIVFMASSRSIPLLTLLSQMVQMEKQFVELRIRALEAIFMKRLQGEEPPHVAAEAGDVLRYVNEVLSLKKGMVAGIKDLHEHLSDRFNAVRKLLSDVDASTRHVVTDKAGPSFGGSGRILDLVLDTLEKFAINPRAPEATRSVLEILKANTPLPVWHATAGPLVDRAIGHAQGGRARSLRNGHAPQPPPRDETRIILTLIVEKTVEVALTVAEARWRATIHQKTKPPVRMMISLEPSNPSWLESVLLDQDRPLKIRMITAALLRILSDASPSIQLTTRAEFYVDLFLVPSLRAAQEKPERRLNLSILGREEQVPFLLEAFNERADMVRWNASRACYAAAQAHPEWFLPQHHMKLLPFLSDRHDRVRLNIVRTFKSLSLHRAQGMAVVIQDISKRLGEKRYRTTDGTTAQGELEAALAAIFDDLCEQVDDLQRQIQWLEAKRRALLDSVEQQALRVGEEIHHEILNTRCGYLATAVDEEDYAEAKEHLDDLVTDLRRIMNNLYPQDLEAEGFLITIRKRLDDAKRLIQRRTPEFTVMFHCPKEVTDEQIIGHLRDRAHLVLLYRIVLEAIVNARKHAQGTYIGVIVHRPKPGFIDIAVSDDGGGHGGPFQENVGLALMRQRVEEIGAEITYQMTSPKGGTTVVIHLPQPHKAALQR